MKNLSCSFSGYVMQWVTALAKGASALSMKPMEVHPSALSLSIEVTISAVLPETELSTMTESLVMRRSPRVLYSAALRE